MGMLAWVLVMIPTLWCSECSNAAAASAVAVGNRAGQFDESFFPVFHIRPPQGHVNDPNAPFRDPKTGYFHLFMQFRLRKEDKIGWSHFVSKNLATWSYLGEPIQPNGKTSCPDIEGCFTGSATIVDGIPSLMYPGVHTVTPPPGSSGDPYVDMAQCLALPADREDPLLRHWTKRLVIPSDSKTINSSRLHDDSAAWKADDGRWWMFVAGSKTLPVGSRPRARKYGLNLLYSSADFRSWRREHSLFDIVTPLDPDGSVNKTDRGSECPFVSCPELYRAPGMGPNERIYEALCGKDRVWVGDYNATAVQFTPRFVNGYYDAGRGHASKSFTDPVTQRRLLWSWIGSPVVPDGTNTSGILMDGYMSVPRDVVWDNTTQQLLINPVAEVAQLRERELTQKGGVEVPLHAPETGVDVPGCHNAGKSLDIVANFSFTRPARQSLDHSLSNSRNLSFGVRFRVGVEHWGEARFNLSWNPGSSGASGASMSVSPSEGSSKVVPVPLVGREAAMQQTFSLRVLLDRPVVEVYAQYGRLRMSVPMRLSSISNRIDAGGENSTNISNRLRSYRPRRHGRGYGDGVQVFASSSGTVHPQSVPSCTAMVSVWRMGSAFAAAPPHV